ncbi:MAG: hypothetical protein ACTSP9_10850 [Promethearchaeota archaeon]
MDKKIKIEGIGNDLIKTCPVCGYSFRILDPTSKKPINKCPMCGTHIIEPHFPPDGKNNFEKRFF